MQNPFLIVRCVFFALLVYLNLVTLIFAAWSVHATMSSGIAVPGVIYFVIFNCCMTFLLVPISLIELFKPRLRVAQVRIECVWTAILSIFEIGAMFSITVNGPLMMCLPSNGTPAACISSSLLAPAAWFGTMTLFGYFLLLFVTSVAHCHSFPEIWSTSVYAIPWFDLGISDYASSRKSIAGGNDDRRSSWNSNGHRPQSDDNASHSNDVQRAGQLVGPPPQFRRGIDQPFARKPVPPLLKPFVLSPKAPEVPKKDGSRFLEVFRQSHVPAHMFRQSRGPARVSRPPVSESVSYYGSDLECVPRVSEFPEEVEDNDKPIPLPHLTQWLRADAAMALNRNSTLPDTVR